MMILMIHITDAAVTSTIHCRCEGPSWCWLCVQPTRKVRTIDFALRPIGTHMTIRHSTRLQCSNSFFHIRWMTSSFRTTCVRRTVDKKQHNLWIPENPSCIPVYLRSLFHINHYLFIIHHDSDTPSYGCCCWWWWYQGDSKLFPSLVVTTTIIIIIIVHTISDDLSKFP